MTLYELELWQFNSSDGFVGVWALTVELWRWLFKRWSFDSRTREMTLSRVGALTVELGRWLCRSWSFYSRTLALTLYKLELSQLNASNEFVRPLSRYEEKHELGWNSLHTNQISSGDLVWSSDDSVGDGALTIELKQWLRSWGFWQLNWSDGFVGVWALTVKLGQCLCTSWSFDSRQIRGGDLDQLNDDFVVVGALTIELKWWLCMNCSFDSLTRVMTLCKLEFWQLISSNYFVRLGALRI